MTQQRSHNKPPHGQRGSVLIWFSLLLPVLLGFTALAIDLARLNLVKVELQNATDAAALAGAFAVSGSSGSYNWSNVTSDAQKLARSNFANGRQIQHVTIDTGYWDLSNPAAGLHSTETLGYLPAVQVTIDISSTKNGGPLNFFFAPIMGIDSSDIQATAIAAQSASGHSILVQ